MAKKAKGAARKTRAAKKPASTRKPAAAAAPKGSETANARIISEQAFAKMMRSIKNAEKDKQSAVGTIGQIIKAAADTDNVDTKALGMYRALEKMSDNKLATALAQFDHFREIGGLDERARKQGQLFNVNPPDLPGEDDEDDDTDVSNLNGGTGTEDGKPMGSKPARLGTPGSPLKASMAKTEAEVKGAFGSKLAEAGDPPSTAQH